MYLTDCGGGLLVMLLMSEAARRETNIIGSQRKMASNYLITAIRPLLTSYLALQLQSKPTA